MIPKVNDFYSFGAWFQSGLLGLSLALAGTAAAQSLASGTAEMASSRSQLSPAAIPPDNVWTLEAALARAMEANADLIAAKFEFERQEGVRLQLRARMLPSLTASGGVNERAKGLVDVSPAQRNLPPSPETAVALYSYDLRLEVRQLLFDGFSSWHQLRRQQLLSSQAYQVLRTAVLRTASAVRQAFDAIQLRTALLAAEQQRVVEFERIVSMTRRKHDVGEVAEFELIRAESELEAAKADVAEARRALGQSEQGLRRLLQMPQSPLPLRVDGTFAPRRFDLPLGQALSQAQSNRPDLRGFELAVEAAKRNERAQIGTYLPKVETFASYGLRSSYYNSAIELDGWTVGVMGQWPIFDGGAARGRRLAARAERRIAETKLAETQHQIASRLSELYQGLDHARVAMEAQEKSLSLATRASRDVKRSYEVGQASFEQVLQSELTLQRAQSRFAESIFNYNSLVADVEFAVGGQLHDSVGLPETWKR